MDYPKFEVIGVTGLPEFKAGDNLGEEILKALTRMNVPIENGDVLVVSQKVVSKVEGMTVDLTRVVPSQRALEIAKACGKDPRFVELVLQESQSVEYVAPGHLIVTTKHGITCANAGIDVSNVDGTQNTVLLLPKDPDLSAKKLKEYIKNKTGKNVAVIISDTHGRTLREGQINVAIGLSGLNPFRDYRGKADMKGYVLRVKLIAVADEIASAAELVIGQATEKIPVALIKGLNVVEEGEYSAKTLNMPKERWFFKPQNKFN
ncbi:coenzyme F420-0:L-glutamate ligase [Candidatus Marsarchaeota G2 archaeon ECH_B_SAG-F08]|jgi:F420-0:gamma-glutamyl ligase|uniref:Coenzyme F420-0:L-glutamate ligase n=4 Tax=Candidatus Marsarchaeota TaxID=1978152 RepID=A0A2R6BZK9_9ARCH|nr:MAG: coenzyme F420-0:L-glutamate ligase [Candidatus Marsarchaeota G1 archaeon OSP_D]PSN87464.1 MAG: coenzyme F420-0:L-glutamate ligase [Candidatus Marsarchaeota G1 archaeon OSP_C]PSN98020.1 MAG: coenzyme F420-0:L-glutamate ligase [Candidatus Marsarchaeota G2 archaeon ECH_B_SAG-F08]PSO03956.1 MAG: coenzyme F420-0:L-glutamate ligase [Candidatus Marsarchaeota G2 archaeon ECH_B_SAG-G06]